MTSPQPQPLEKGLHPALQSQAEAGNIDPSRIPDGQLAARRKPHLLAEAIQAAPKLISLRLSECHINELGLQAIIQAAATHSELEQFSLGRNAISPDTAHKLAEALQNFPKLKSLRLRDTGLDAASFAPIMDALRDHPSLEWVNFGQNALSGDAARNICETLQTIPTLQHLNMMASGLQAADAIPIAAAVRKLPNLLNLHLHSNTGLEVPEARTPIIRALLDTPHPNLHSVVDKIPDVSLRELLVENNTKVTELRSKLFFSKDRFEDIRCADFARIGERIPLLSRQPDMIGNDIMPQIQHFLAHEIPTLGENEIPSPTRLLNQNARELTVLDNPETWKHVDTLAEKMETAGFTLDSAFLSGKNSRGETWLECGLACAPEKVIPTLNARGITFQAKALLQDGSASPLLRAVIGSSNVRPLFTEQNWQGGNPREIQQVYDALPKTAKLQVGLHRLKQQVQATQRAGNGIGR